MSSKVYLYTRDSKDKIRVLTIEIQKTNEGYVIVRHTGILNGKLVAQPVLTVNKGKVKRTVEEQVRLQFDSKISDQRDKGYKTLDEFIPDGAKVDVDDYIMIDKFFPSEKTDALGQKKPNLATDTNKLKGKIDKKTGKDKYDLTLARAFWESAKLDGVRTLAEASANRFMNFKSRTGKPFKGVTHHFAQDKELYQFCKEHNCEIDGEFYIHGMPLKNINGTCALDEYVPERHDDIKFYIFDMACDHLDATARCKILNQTNFENPRIVVLRHKYVVGKEQAEEFLDECVAAGFEGAMLRTAIGMYEFGKRSKELLKLKPFQDDEFTITGISEGLREEDMCFTMKTDEGVEFKAKPEGTAEDKQEYRKNIDNLIGKKGTVKYQYLTEDGKPFLPVFKCVRNE